MITEQIRHDPAGGNLGLRNDGGHYRAAGIASTLTAVIGFIPITTVDADGLKSAAHLSSLPNADAVVIDAPVDADPFNVWAQHFARHRLVGRRLNRWALFFGNATTVQPRGNVALSDPDLTGQVGLPFGKLDGFL
jgi:hypothetical protein